MIALNALIFICIYSVLAIFDKQNTSCSTNKSDFSYQCQQGDVYSILLALKGFFGLIVERFPKSEGQGTVSLRTLHFYPTLFGSQWHCLPRNLTSHRLCMRELAERLDNIQSDYIGHFCSHMHLCCVRGMGDGGRS